MRILIIEDKVEILESLKQSLEEQCFVVDTAVDGNSGAELAYKNEYDFIILDNHLPKKTGMEICKEIRSLKKRVPILILSVEKNVLKKVEFLNSGADDYITKPFSFQELLARIRAIIRRPRHVLEDEYHLDDLIVNVSKHFIQRGKKQIHLTKKEFMILEHLMRNQGYVVSRNSLVEHVWDMHGDIFSNSIETHIMTLRKKIDTKSRKKLIHTISGRGYKMALQR